MGKNLFAAAAVAALLLGSPPPAEAEKAQGGWTLAQSLGGAINPLAAEYAVRVFRTRPLFPGRAGRLWESARIEAGFHNALTPAYDTFSVFVLVEPAAVFDLHLSAGVRGYYDLFGFGYTPLAGFDAPFDASTRRNLDRSGEAGFRYSATPTLKGALGPLLFSHSAGFVLLDMRGADTAEDHYFEPVSNAILARFGGYLSNDSLLAYDFGGGFLGGLAHSFLFVPASSYVSQKILAVCRVSLPMGERVDFSAAFLGGVFLRDRYHSYRDGTVHLAAQGGMRVRL